VSVNYYDTLIEGPAGLNPLPKWRVERFINLVLIRVLSAHALVPPNPEDAQARLGCSLPSRYSERPRT
jgi:hypothetical protein